MTARQYRIPPVVLALVNVPCSRPRRRRGLTTAQRRSTRSKPSRSRASYALRVGQSARLHLACGAGRRRRDGRVASGGPASSGAPPPGVVAGHAPRGRHGPGHRQPGPQCAAEECAARLAEARRYHAVRRPNLDERAHHLRCSAGSGGRRDRRCLGDAARHGRDAEFSESRPARSAHGGWRRRAGRLR